MQDTKTADKRQRAWAEGIDDYDKITAATLAGTPSGPRMLQSLVQALSALAGNWQRYTGDK